MACIYNSRSEDHKTPFGAVPCGENITFTLRVPQSHACTQPRLLLAQDGEEAVPLIMNAAGIIACEKGEDIKLFTLEITAGDAGLYFYWFDLWVDYQKLYRGLKGESVVSQEEGKLYQLTVYNKDFITPKELYGGVMYQIFPDRFYDGELGKPLVFNERVFREDKRKEPYFWPDNKSGGYLTKDYFGGDFIGIEKKLPFLDVLGVTIIYLNPIFEAHSNHRYNTADYMNADPYLGTNEDFTRLCTAAKELGIKIILDGVFSHTGSDSIYFNQDGRYPSLGAWQGKHSPYRSWFSFCEDGTYDSWWGFETLPTCNKSSPDFRKFICGKDGVIDTWIKRGAAGFRLDVADELPDDFIAEIRTSVKRCGNDKLLIGEVWEDASNKEAYGKRRHYFEGSELDGVMNYPFRDAILNFLSSTDAPMFEEEIMTICENYPPPALNVCTTHISTHDTVRAITQLAGENVEGHSRNWQSGRLLSHGQYHLGIRRLRLAFVLQFTLPGIPCVYYGDEIAMQGYKDPFNRAYYNWQSPEDRIIPLMMGLSEMRKKCPAFKDGVLCFIKSASGVLVFERENATHKATIAVNCSGWLKPLNIMGEDITLPMMGFTVFTQEKGKKPLRVDLE